ncbi:hypothetical protein M430DRAFT_223459 [Amorphotheca resinae ATCC 22711]|jgi:hypothetical protein|uniref:Uncharacterized protein n=1 Tax=Amorphotheca resinae ATCC 22711 TaxID=857342 RepID=A0A2T3B696_AMORE|nr:hypothetical protein M430DRAFT_223459 [Amorphotheca resinae ATCC 22711]PSS22272.1 hypothetical protein M430DRAFT_223459 [Amorphotheca resinae ATCC 22711]
MDSYRCAYNNAIILKEMGLIPAILSILICVVGIKRCLSGFAADLEISLQASVNTEHRALGTPRFRESITSVL